MLSIRLDTKNKEAFLAMKLTLSNPIFFTRLINQTQSYIKSIGRSFFWICNFIPILLSKMDLRSDLILLPFYERNLILFDSRLGFPDLKIGFQAGLGYPKNPSCRWISGLAGGLTHQYYDLITTLWDNWLHDLN